MKKPGRTMKRVTAMLFAFMLAATGFGGPDKVAYAFEDTEQLFMDTLKTDDGIISDDADLTDVPKTVQISDNKEAVIERSSEELIDDEITEGEIPDGNEDIEMIGMTAEGDGKTNDNFIYVSGSGSILDDTFTSGYTKLNDGQTLIALKSNGASYEAVKFVYKAYPEYSELYLKDYKTAGNAGYTTYSHYTDGIRYKGNLKILCEGTNQIHPSYSTAVERFCGIDVEGDLTITNTGNGNAILDIGTNKDTTFGGEGIYSEGSLTIKNSGSGSIKVTAEGGSGKATDYVGSFSYGIAAKSDINIYDATVTATGRTGSKRGYDNNTAASSGISTMEGNIKINNATVTATGGTSEWISVGITAEKGDITINGGTVTVMSGTAPEGRAGLYIAGGHTLTMHKGTLNAYSDDIAIYAQNMVMHGGTVCAEGNGVGKGGYGYGIDILSLAMDGGEITAKGPDLTSSGSYSYGIYCTGNVTMSGGTITAAGGTLSESATESSIGVSFAKLNMSGGNITASGGDIISESGRSYGIYLSSGEGSYSGGILNGTGGDAGAGGTSNGVYIYNKTIALKGTVLRAKGHTHGISGNEGNDPEISANGFMISTAFDGSDAILRKGEGLYKIVSAFSKYKNVVAANAPIHILSFDLNGGPGMTPGNQIIIEGDKAEEPKAPAAEGFVFGGWFADKECTIAFDFAKTITENVTLYAKWIHNCAAHSAMDPKPVMEGTTEIWLVKGQKFTLDKGWESADKTKITVNKNGQFTVKNTGEALLKKEEMTIRAHILKPSVTKKLILEAGNTDTIKITDYNADMMPVLFFSEKNDVATVDNTGKVTGAAKGKVKITAYINGVAHNCSVTVKEGKPAKERTLHLNVKGSKSISIKGLKKPVWTPSTEGIVSIKKNKIKGEKAGTTVLTTSGNEVYKVNVFVEDITVSGEGITPVKTNKYTLNLKKGQTTDIKLAQVYQSVLFKSNKPDIAFIDENGHIEARSKGKCKITSKVNGKTITINVTVSE